MIVYLIRHGQTTGDVENRYGGDYDDHLTELGKKQSASVTKKISSAGIEAIYCSPKIRAQETATIIKEALPHAVCMSVKDLRERNRYGILSGITKAEAAERYPEQVKLLADEHQTLKGGEGYESFGQRITSALNKVAETENYKTVAVVTHGGPIRYIFREILREGEIEIGDCAFAKLEFKNSTPILLELDGIKLQG